MEDYRTIHGTATGEYEEKKSRFIAALSFADSEEAAVAFLEQVRAANRTARHNVRDKREQQHANRSHDGEQHARGEFILQGNAASKSVFCLLALRSIRRPLRQASSDGTLIGDHFVNTSGH